MKFIPTQIFLDASGKELFRHVGFFSKDDILAKWKELGVDLALREPASHSAGWSPPGPTRAPKDGICYMCDGDVNPKTRVTRQDGQGRRHLCSPHCFFITCIPA